MFETVKGLFRKAKDKIKDKIRKRLKDLPPLSQVIQQRHVFAAALVSIGNELSAIEPNDVFKLDYVAAAVDAAEFAADVTESIPGLEKLDEVRDACHLAWKGVNKVDEGFDKFWETKARPFINNYVAKAREEGYFKEKSA